jgi:hypothetical protein
MNSHVHHGVQSLSHFFAPFLSLSEGTLPHASTRPWAPSTPESCRLQHQISKNHLRKSGFLIFSATRISRPTAWSSCASTWPTRGSISCERAAVTRHTSNACCHCLADTIITHSTAKNRCLQGTQRYSIGPACTSRAAAARASSRPAA